MAKLTRSRSRLALAESPASFGANWVAEDQYTVSVQATRDGRCYTLRLSSEEMERALKEWPRLRDEKTEDEAHIERMK